MSRSEKKGSGTLQLRPVQRKLNTKEQLQLGALRLVFLWLYTAGSLGIFASALALPLEMGLLVLALGTEAALFCFLPDGDRKPGGRIRVLYLEILVLLVLAIPFFHFWINGLNVLLNTAIDAFGKLHPYMLPHYRITVSESAEVGALWYFLLWIGAWMQILGRMLLKKGNIVLLGMQEILLLFLQMVTGIHASLTMNLLLLLAIVAMWIWAQGCRIPEGWHRLAAAEAVLILLVLGIAAAGAAKVVSSRVYRGSNAWASVRTAIRERIEEARWTGENEVLPGGQFTDLGSFLPEDKEVLRVTMSTPETYYLRGFTGSEYTGKGWKETASEQLWSGRDLFYWLHEDGFYGDQELALAAKSLNEDKDYEPNLITVENISANRRYLLTPYELAMTDDEAAQLLKRQKIGDESITSSGLKGQTVYTYTAYPELITEYPVLDGKLAKPDQLSKEGRQYKEEEGYYNEFVYKNYLQLPENIRQDLDALLDGAVFIADGEKHADYGEAKEDILYVLTKECRYETRLSARWKGLDLVDDFLTRTKSGYSVHYASAAVLMFRYFGIPARYVEGYLITPEDADKMTAETAYSLDETHAHAWAEYYQDGVGWLPFETTPAYLNVMNQAQQYQNISQEEGSARQDPPPEEEEEEEEQEEEQKPSDIDWIFVLECVLVLLIFFVLIFLIWLVIRIVKDFRENRKLRNAFDDPDRRIAVRSIFAYSMNLLSVAGLQVRNVSLFTYGKEIGNMFGPEWKKEYSAVVKIRQEAVYSEHEVSEEAYQRMLNFEQEVRKRVYEDASRIRRLQLKLIYMV